MDHTSDDGKQHAHPDECFIDILHDYLLYHVFLLAVENRDHELLYGMRHVLEAVA